MDCSHHKARPVSREGADHIGIDLLIKCPDCNLEGPYVECTRPTDELRKLVWKAWREDLKGGGDAMSRDMVTEALKPCPFCGSADVEQRKSITDAMVACNNCGSRTGFVFLGASDAANAAKMREQRDIWNTRAQSPATEDSELIEAERRLASLPSPATVALLCPECESPKLPSQTLATTALPRPPA